MSQSPEPLADPGTGGHGLVTRGCEKQLPWTLGEQRAISFKSLTCGPSFV